MTSLFLALRGASTDGALFEALFNGCKAKNTQKNGHQLSILLKSWYALCKGKSSLTVTSMAAEAGEAAPLLPQHTTAEPPETPAGCKFEEFFKLGVWQNQWPLQEPNLEVPTIFKAYFSGLNFRGYPHKIWPKIWYIMVPPSVGSWRSPVDKSYQLGSPISSWGCHLTSVISRPLRSSSWHEMFAKNGTSICI